MNRAIGSALLALAFSLVLAGCGGSSVTVTRTATPTAATTQTSMAPQAATSTASSTTSAATSSSGAGTTSTQAPIAPLPTLVVGSWAGTEPSEIDFSGDGGNVVTGIRWSLWTSSGAVGNGTSDIQNCVPNCAQGTNTPVTTTITLSAPQDGHFTQMTEARNGQSTTVSSGSSSTWPIAASS